MGVDLGVHAVFHLCVQDVRLAQASLQFFDFVRCFLYLVFSLICACFKGVDVVVTLRVDRLLVAFELFEVPEDLLVVALSFSVQVVCVL